MAKAAAWLVLPMAGGGDQTFADHAALIAWIAEVRSSWAPLLGNVGRIRGVELGRDRLNGTLTAMAGATDPEAIRGSVISQFPSGCPFAPSDAVREAIRKRYSAAGTGAEGTALGSIIWAAMKRAPNVPLDLGEVGHPICLETIGFAAAIREVGARNNGAVLSAAISRASTDIAELLAAGKEDAAAQSKAFDEMMDESLKKIAAGISNLHQTIGAARDELNTTEARFAEIMRMKAPVDYWAAKSVDHRKSVRVYRFWLTGLTLMFLPVLGGVYWGGWHALDRYTTTHPAAAIGMTLYVAGFVGAVTAVGLWFIRIVVRLYMSQHHLMADAEERASFLRTYLSLAEGGNVSETERALVLASVFRPVPDGLVHDDGAPTLSLASVFAGMLDKK